AHEAIHIVFCHVFLIAKKIKEIRNEKDKNQINTKINEFITKINIAADCVVNDSLVNLYNFSKIMEKTILFGKQIVGTDCHNLSIQSVYKLLPKDKTANTLDIHDWESFLDGNGNVKKEFAQKIKDFFDRNCDNSALSDKEEFLIEESLKSFKEESGSILAGTGKLGQKRSIVKVSRKYIRFDKLLFDLTDSKIVEDKWNRQNRKLSCVYPKIILPKYEQKEVETIFVAIDASGSIDKNALSLFVDVICNTSKKFKIKAVSFDVGVYDFDIYSGDWPKGGGGTSFQAIEDYIVKEFKQHPKVVCVLTDGRGDFVKPKYKDRWVWFLYGSSSKVYCKNMRTFDLKNFLS
ncbi:hypothetical protein HYV49_03235, partial [Candidatus Pacearchaeota archaeon]|nr:hypothetical protein [Candidatus Pacearchaeota archaeon]